MKFNSESLGKEKMLHLLIRLSLPATFGMLMNALYNLVDAIFIGRGVGRDALGGIAIAFPVQMIIIGFGFLIGMGSASLISRSLGQGDKEKAKNTVGNAMMSGLVLSIFIVALVTLFLDKIIMLFGSTDELFIYTKDYLSVIVIGSPFLIIGVITNNIIRSEGNAKMAMITMAAGAILNIGLDPIFIYGLDMGIKGAALATIISQMVNFVIGMIYIVGPKTSLKFSIRNMKVRLDILREVVAVGVSAFVRQIAGSLVAIALNNVIKIHGGDLASLYISSFGIVNRIIAFMFMPMFGVVQAFQPIAGYNYGAKKMSRVLESIKFTLVIMTIIGTINALVGELFPKFFISLFIEDIQTIEAGSTILKYILIFVPLIGVQIISATLFQAIGRAKPALFLALLRQLILLVPLLLILPNIFGIVGIWVSYPVADLLSVVIAFILFKKETNILKRMSREELVQ